MREHHSEHIPHPQVPHPLGIDALRALLRSHVRDGAASTPDDAWRLVARVMSANAHDRALRVEELLISLKRAWPVLADTEQLPRLESSRLLARLVTLCVEEYYAPLG
jgi:hypothetical protein